MKTIAIQDYRLFLELFSEFNKFPYGSYPAKIKMPEGAEMASVANSRGFNVRMVNDLALDTLRKNGIGFALLSDSEKDR
jgi:hypothetical protein